MASDQEKMQARIVALQAASLVHQRVSGYIFSSSDLVTTVAQEFYQWLMEPEEDE
jgi:hypothetical protein